MKAESASLPVRRVVTHARSRIVLIVAAEGMLTPMEVVWLLARLMASLVRARTARTVAVEVMRTPTVSVYPLVLPPTVPARERIVRTAVRAYTLTECAWRASPTRIANARTTALLGPVCELPLAAHVFTLTALIVNHNTPLMGSALSNARRIRIAFPQKSARLPSVSIRQWWHQRVAHLE